MEETMKEIASQLGVGIEQIWNMAPRYADMVCLNHLMILIIEAVIFIPIFIIAYRQFKKDKYNDIATVILIVGSVGLFILIVTMLIAIPDIIQWKLYPQEKFLRLLLNR